MKLQGNLSALGLLLLISAGNARAEEFTPSPSLGETAKSIEAKLTGPGFTPANCASEIRQVYNVMYAKPADFFTDLRALQPSSDTANPDAITRFFRTRVKVQELLRKFVVEKGFGTDQVSLQNCARQARVAIRLLRGLEDYWGMHMLAKAGKLGETTPHFAPGAPHTLVNPAYEKEWKFPEGLEAGDFLLSRGSAFTSAVISRVGTIDNQFSHLAVLHIEDGSVLGAAEKGKRFVIEAEPNGGVMITPWEKYLSDGKARIVVFRLRNVMPGQNATPAAEVAKLAAHLITEKAKAGNICYNFGMDMKDTNCLFCSQLNAVAMGLACGQPGVSCETLPYARPNDYPVPLFLTKFAVDKNPLMRMLEMKVTETFSPADVEIEPKLDLVAEWRNYAALENARVFDAVMTRMFHWMEHGGYQLRDDSQILNYAAHFADKVVKELNKMPPNTPPGFVKGSMLLYFLMQHTGPGSQNILGSTMLAKLQSMGPEDFRAFAKKFKLKEPTDAELKEMDATFDEVANRLINHKGFSSRLLDANKQYYERSGYFLTDYQLGLAMEGYRRLDCKEYQEKGETRFHDLFGLKFGVPAAEACSVNPL